MPNLEILESADPTSLLRFDAIIDVRSPAEFAEDHLPSAINLPVLDDAERARVGTLYVQDSQFRARRIGAALVARNIASHLETALADKPADFRPLIYCWRGGQRSNAMAAILSQVGWRTTVLRGGYKTYRRRVNERLYDQPLGLDLVLLDGGTGSGKTDVLRALAALGVQTLDLESLAQHRGSLFGGRAGEAQPSQKLFESRLLAALETFGSARPVVVEAESHKIGDRMIPPALWRSMADASRIELAAPRAERAHHLVRAYPELTADRALLKATITRLPSHVGRSSLEVLQQHADAGAFVELADALMDLHYDPAYARSNRNGDRARLARIELARVDAQAIADAAQAIATLLLSGVPSQAGETRAGAP